MREIARRALLHLPNPTAEDTSLQLTWRACSKHP